MGRYAHRPCCPWFVHLRVRLTKPPQIAMLAGWGCGRSAVGIRVAATPHLRRLVQVSCGWPRAAAAFDLRASAGGNVGMDLLCAPYAGGSVLDLRKPRHLRVDGQVCPSTLLSMVRQLAGSPYETSTNRQTAGLAPRRACSGLQVSAAFRQRRLVQVSCGWLRVGRTPDLRVPAGARAASERGGAPSRCPRAGVRLAGTRTEYRRRAG